ncbi:MAG: caspase family protein [Beijerinckiaceae bacterium]|nr:caspase family protein [Beijerinckiaceae bacterium]
MRVIFVLFILSLITGPAAAQPVDAVSSGLRVALIIGNASYPNADPKLTQPIGNARALGDELTRNGFQVEVGENLTKQAMQRAFGRLYDRIKPGAVALIFFSGFGIQSNRQSYMIPVDGQIYKEDDVRHDGISVDNVLSGMNRRGASVKIAILDASRRNRFEGNFRVAPLGLALPANPPSGTLVMYSAGSGSVVRDSAADRSLFVSELLKEMRAPGVPAEEVFNRTRMGVLRASQGEQNPSNYSSLNEDFAFGQQVPAVKPIVKSNLPAVPRDTTAEEQHDFELAKQSGTGTAWADFLDKHPSGHYTGLAREELAKLDVPAVTGNKPISNPPVVEASPDVKDLNAIKNLDKYIQNNPSDASAFYRRGQLYAKRGDFSDAVKDFDEALRLHPNDAEALNNRCWARAMVGDSMTALKDCNEALRLRPAYADALDSRGFVKLKIGEPSSAIVDYDAALHIKKQPSSLYGRGVAKKQTGDTAGGDSDIAAAKAIDPAIAAEFDRSGFH